MFPIPLPWILISATIALFGTYQVGHHYGWLERDEDMQIEIAKKNEEARELEKNMTSKLADKETALRKAKNEISNKQSAMRELANTGRLRLPATSCIQTSRQANLSDRLLQLLSTSLPKETKPSSSTQPVSQPTTK